VSSQPWLNSRPVTGFILKRGGKKRKEEEKKGRLISSSTKRELWGGTKTQDGFYGEMSLDSCQFGMEFGFLQFQMGRYRYWVVKMTEILMLPSVNGRAYVRIAGTE